MQKQNRTHNKGNTADRYAPADFFVMLKGSTMRFKLFITFFILVISTYAYCEDTERSILGYIDNKAFWLNIPNGWYQDQKVAGKFGAIFFLIPSGYDFNNAPAVIYATSFKNKSAKQALLHDEEVFKAKDRDIKMSRPEIIKNKKGKNIVTREFESKVLRSQPFEVIAYIEEKGVTITVVASAFDKQNFDIILPEFKKMVASYELADIKSYR